MYTLSLQVSISPVLFPAIFWGISPLESQIPSPENNQKHKTITKMHKIHPSDMWSLSEHGV